SADGPVIMRTALWYSAFAALAMLVNIGGQELTLLVYAGRFSIYPAIVTGTLAGLLLKYQLDKRYIFGLRTPSPREDLSRFTLYTITGIITSLLFWGTELAFDLLFATRQCRYAGAVHGLCGGYILK